MSVGFADGSKAAEGPRSSIYAVPALGQGIASQDDRAGLLPIRSSDQPRALILDQSGRQPAAPQVSIVEAIPTPTAFHAGAILLLAIFLTRCFRKLRWA